MPKKNRKNPKKENALKSFETQNSLNNNISKFCCFNFKYFRSTENGQSFEEWQGNNILADLMNKLKEFSQLSVEELKQNHRLKIYGPFPTSKCTDFKLPTDLPKNGIKWSSFRITGEKRLIGFFVSKEAEIDDCKNIANTFYVVFLDENHKFYKSIKKHT